MFDQMQVNLVSVGRFSGQLKVKVLFELFYECKYYNIKKRSHV